MDTHTTPIRVLLVDDESSNRALALRALRRTFPDVEAAEAGDQAEFEQALKAERPDLVVTDYHLGWSDGLDIFRRVKAQWPDIPVMMLTGTGSEEIAVEAMKAGLDDYVVKSAKHIARLPEAVRAALERAREKQALREAETRYRELVQTVPIGLYSTTPDGRITAANPALVNMLGYPNQDSLMAAKAEDLYVSPQNRQREREELAREGIVRGFELQLRRRDGTIISARDTVRAVRDAGDRVLRYEASLEDITEQKRAESETEERQRYLESVLAAVPDAIVTLDAQHRIAEWNRGAEQLFGYSKEEILGDDLDPLITNSHALGEATDYTHNVMEGNLLGPVETVRCRKDGTSVDVIVAGAPILVDGKFAGAVAIYTDITDRKRAERQIQERQRYLESVLASAPDAIVTLDAQHRIVEWNRGAEQLFGYSKEEVLAQDLDPLITNSQALGEATGYTREVMGGNALGPVETVRYHKDGSPVHVILASAPVLVGGELAGAVAVYTDITDRKQAERELQRAKDAAEAADRAKGEFLANMSHEIRTPMNGIIGMTELALDTDLTSEQREYLTMVKSSADSLLRILNDILDFSKIEAQKLELESVNFSLRDSLGDTMKSLALRAHQKGLELAYRVPPSIPDALVGDPGRLRQIVVNLVGNAIKFTERGEVVLHVGAESESEDETVLHFAVTDTGIGVPPEKQQSIFSAFTQVDTSTTRQYGGTGLGLTISSRLVELMSGRIWVESQVGQGSTFHFTARFGIQKGLKPKTLASLEDLKGLPVLVVDDNETNRFILKEMLASWKMRPTLAEDGASALHTLMQAQEDGTPFALAIVDMHMPHMDGFMLAELAKNNPRLGNIAIMLLSSSGKPGDAARCRELGIEAYMMKPAKQSELMDAVLTIFGESERQRAETDLITRHSLREERKRLRILVAEDNLVNQRLASRLLEKRGHFVTVVGNGEEALDALARKPFDLVLMDVQMPKMDGFQATAKIREREAEAQTHIPIVAMTAHALEGDRERCVAAGMDGYVAKPLDARELFAVVESLTPTPDEREWVPLLPASLAAFDKDAAMKRMGGNEALLREIVDLFFDESRGLLAEIEAGIAARDAATLQRAAHTMKGLVRNFGAEDAANAAQKMEMMAEEGQLEGVEDTYAALKKEVERLTSELQEWRGTYA